MIVRTWLMAALHELPVGRLMLECGMNRFLAYVNDVSFV
jgi:hypothetical protein